MATGEIIQHNDFPAAEGVAFLAAVVFATGAIGTLSDAGVATLQALGVGEAPLMTEEEPSEGASTPPLGADVLDDVTRRAGDFAAGREAQTVGTADLLMAVFDVYGKLFEHALYLRGTGREELVEKLNTVSHTQG